MAAPTHPTPLVPPERLADWLITVRHLKEDVESQRITHHAIADRLGDLLDQMRTVAYRKGEL